MRVAFAPGRQQDFLEDVQRATGADAQMLAGRIGVHARTFRDWRREKWQMDEISLQRLCQVAHLSRPRGITILAEHWSVPKSSRLGGLRRIQLHGSPGTFEGRRRGGQNAQKRFRSDPDYYRSLGVAVRKKIGLPAFSVELAEFIGIMLGDGGMTDYQATISFNRLDSAYGDYVEGLARKLFHIAPRKTFSKEDQVFYLIMSGVELIERLETLGLRRGNKVKHQVDIPDWVWQRREYQIGCLRGLMDTDGCVYRHRYAVNGKTYAYTKLCFTSYSSSLLHSAKKMFESLDLHPTIHAYDGHRLYLHGSKAVKRYFEVVGTHNSRYQERFDVFTGRE